METTGIFDQPDPVRTLGIEVEDKQFWFCRGTLASYSPVFKAMLYGEFAESDKDVITLPGKKAKDVEELLLCLRPREEQKRIDDSNLEMLMALADEYQIKDISIRAELFLMKKLTKCGTADKAMLDLLKMGSKYQMKQFLSRCIKRCVKEFPLSELKPLFPDLRSDVVVSLALAVLEPAKDGPCRQFSFVRYSGKAIRCCGCRRSYYGNGMYQKCLWCGNIYCEECAANKKCGEVRGHS